MCGQRSAQNDLKVIFFSFLFTLIFLCVYLLRDEVIIGVSFRSVLLLSYNEPELQIGKRTYNLLFILYKTDKYRTKLKESRYVEAIAI